jgi:hypothetical protein
MTSMERLSVAALMVVSAGAGVTSAIYLRPLQPTQQQAVAPPVLQPPIQVRPVRTVTWFVEHRSELRSKLAQCNDNPGVGASDPECLNVETAKQKVDAADLIKAFSHN